MTTDQPSTLVVGRIIKPHGVRGELVVDVRTDEPEQRFAPGSVLGVQRGETRLPSVTVSDARPHSGRLLVQFEGVAGRTAAEDLRGAFLTVSVEQLEPTGDPDEFYDHELEGLRAVLVDGADLGVVREVVHTPGGELLAVDRPGETTRVREVLVPFVSEIVPEVDLAGGRVVIDPPEGLLDES